MWVLVLATAIAWMQSSGAPPPHDPTVESAIGQAESAYRSGRLIEAVTTLQGAIAHEPDNFAAHELLGLVYAAQAQKAKARGEFETAVHLKPSDTSALNNFAIASVQTGRPEDAAAAWQRVLTIAPDDPAATASLAKLYLSENQVTSAIPLLERAWKADPHATDLGYNLALAYLLTGRLEPSHRTAETLLRARESGEVHSLLGQIDEKQGLPVQAANEFAAAARLDPSENNLFLWASELMLHRAYEPAIAVYRRGTEQYPGSPRLWIGMGMAQYSRGEYEGAIRSLLRGASLDPRDPRCYLFLSKAYLSAPSEADEVIAAFRRYAELEPGNARAQFFYAVSLWKGRRLANGEVDFKTVESLLQRSIALDGRDPQAHLQLGILYNDEGAYPQSLPELERAAALDPTLADAHFRLARFYFRAGDKAKGQAEMDRFRDLQQKHQAELDQERAAMQQFVVTTQNGGTTQP